MSRRFREAALDCLLGCHGDGRDDIRHDLVCPVVRRLVGLRKFHCGRLERLPANAAGLVVALCVRRVFPCRLGRPRGALGKYATLVRHRSASKLAQLHVDALL